MSEPSARGRSLGAAAARAARQVCSPAAARGAAREVAWIVAHAVAYPLGVAAERSSPAADRHSMEGLAPVQRALLIGDVAAAGTPILLVHGLVDNRSIFAVLRRHLRRRGFGRIATVNYSVFTTDVRAAAERLGAAVERLVEETGYERVHVVGHSLGGLVARYYVQRLGGDRRVHTLVTLGTPHAGTRMAYVLPHRLFRQLRPGSELLAELAQPAPGCRTRFVAIYSDLDQMIVPATAGRLDHPDLRASNVQVHAVGHLSLPIHGPIAHQICLALAHLDADGDTIAPSVTALDPGWGQRPA